MLGNKTRSFDIYRVGWNRLGSLESAAAFWGDCRPLSGGFAVGGPADK